MFRFFNLTAGPSITVVILSFMEFLPPSVCVIPLIDRFSRVELYVYLTVFPSKECLVIPGNVEKVVIVEGLGSSSVTFDIAFISDGRKVYVGAADVSSIEGNMLRGAVRPLR